MLTDTPLTFTPYPDEPTDHAGEPVWAWTAGRYKIVRYDDVHVPEWKYLGPVFHAYFKPDGWENWGNRTHRNVPGYRTFTEAAYACQAHAEVGEYDAEKGRLS